MVVSGGIRHPFVIDFSIGVDDTTPCYFTDTTFTLTPTGEHPVGTTYEWNFGSGATPLTATGIGPHVVEYSTTGVKTITVTASYQSVVTEEQINVTVVSCAGNILGTLEDALGSPLVNHNLRLYEDFDDDGVPDGAAVKSVFTNGSGGWSMATIVPGNYVFEFVQPGSGKNLVSATDLGTQEPIVDVLTIIAGPIPTSEYFKIPIRPSAIQGSIELITD